MAEPLPDWLMPEGGITAADLDRLPGLPEHTELIDGGLHFMSPQKRFHQNVGYVLWTGLRAVAPADLAVEHEMSIILNKRNRPIPDICVIDRSAVGGPDDTSYPASAVHLAVEVVSPDSEERDRKRKPDLYAEAGIRHFWRIEQAGDTATVYVYELDPATSTYALSGIHHDRLRLTQPFPLDISLDLSTL